MESTWGWQAAQIALLPALPLTAEGSLPVCGGRGGSPAQLWGSRQPGLRCRGGFWAGAEFWFSACPVVLHLQDSPRPIHFPGWIPNSVVLQQMWLPGEIGGPGALSQLTSVGTLKARGGTGRLP